MQRMKKFTFCESCGFVDRHNFGFCPVCEPEKNNVIVDCDIKDLDGNCKLSGKACEETTCEVDFKCES